MPSHPLLPHPRLPQHKSEDLPITSVERRAFTATELAAAQEASRCSRTRACDAALSQLLLLLAAEGRRTPPPATPRSNGVAPATTKAASSPVQLCLSNAGADIVRIGARSSALSKMLRSELPQDRESRQERMRI